MMTIKQLIVVIYMCIAYIHHVSASTTESPSISPTNFNTSNSANQQTFSAGTNNNDTQPSISPTWAPTLEPTLSNTETENPTPSSTKGAILPSTNPTTEPTIQGFDTVPPTDSPTQMPSGKPSALPTKMPISAKPTYSPAVLFDKPSPSPTFKFVHDDAHPTMEPTQQFMESEEKSSAKQFFIFLFVICSTTVLGTIIHKQVKKRSRTYHRGERFLEDYDSQHRIAELTQFDPIQPSEINRIDIN